MISFFNRKKIQSGDDSDMKKITKKFKISGMHCVACALNIADALEDLDGVFEANVSYAKSELELSFDENKLNEDEINSLINELGYEILK